MKPKFSSQIPVSDSEIKFINFLNVLTYYRDELRMILEDESENSSKFKKLLSDGELQQLIRNGVIVFDRSSAVNMRYRVSWVARTALEKIE